MNDFAALCWILWMLESRTEALEETSTERIRSLSP